MKKRILSLFLCFVLCLSLCPTAAFADGEEGHTHEQQEETPLVVSATMSPEPTEAPAEPAPEPEEEPAEPTPEPTAAPEATQAPAEPAPEVETMPEPTAEPEIDSETDGVDEAVAAVQVLIDALPAVDSVSAEDYDAVQNAYDAYDALTAEQQALITGAEAFEALFNWLNEQVMELAEEHEHNYLNGICTAANYCYQPAEQDSDGYYQIGNAGQLYWFANWVNGGHPDSNAKLTGDIIVNSGEFDANGNCTGTDTPRKISWIGQSNYLYKGTFNGNKHTICGLYYKAGGKTGTVGLFRPNGATIQDLTIDNMYISAPQNIVGLIVENNCSVTVENVTVQNSYIISQNAGEVGAIVAKLKSGSVSNCRSINNVVQGKSNVGAIVGRNSGGTVKNCYSTNTVKSGNNTVSKVVGSGAAQNCYYLANEETTMQNGVAGKTAAQFKSGEVAYLLNGSKDNGTWKQTIGTDDFPGFTGGAVYRTSPCLTYTNDAGNLNKEHDKVKGTCTVCGEGCQHTNWTNGVCADCEETAVASMSKPGADTSYFMDLGKALLAAAADSGCTVAVLENVSSDVTVELSSYSANITLDLNGKTVTKLSYKYGGEICPLTVTDSASGGTLTELTLQSATATVTGGTVTTLNVTGGNVSISGGTVTAMNADNYAEVTISDGTVGTVTFQNGTLRDSDPSITLNVSGGTVTAITGDFGSKVAVSAGTVKTLNVKDGEVSLTGGSYERITGAETITLGDLLPVGKVFAKGSDIKPYSTALTSDGIDLTGYSITACEHDCELDDVGCCSGCGADREVIIVKANGGETKYPTAAAAFAAAKEYTSATVTLRKDVHASETITLDKGTITLELGGHTLSGGDSKVLDLKGSATLIVNAALGGTIRNTYMGWNAPIAVSEKAKLTLANTQVTNDSDGDLTLGGGETTIEAGANIQVNVSISSGKLTVTGGTMTKLTARGGEVSLTGGTFDKIEVSGSGASCYSLLEEGYAFARKSDGETLVDGTVAMLKNVTVVSHPAHNYDVETGKCACGLVRAAQIGKGDAAVVYSSLEAALEAAQNGDTITLLADVTAPRIGTGNNNQIDWSGKSGKITIDLNGKNLSCGGSLYIYGDVTITDSNTTNQGSVVVGTYLSSTQYVYVGESPKTGHLTIAGGNFSKVTLQKGTLNVSGGTITGDTTIAHQGSGSATITGGSFQKLTISGDTNSIVTLKGGSFSEIQGAAKGSLLDCLGSDRAFWRSDGTSLKVVSGACKSLDAEAGISYSVSGHTCSKSDVKNGKCDCGRVYEACIGDTFYASFEAAVTAAGSGDVITLLVDLAALPQMKAGFDPIEPAALVEDDGSSAEGEGPADYSIFQPGKNVTIDLNGYSITGESPLYLIGSMTITDSTTTGAAGTVGGSTTSIIIGGGSVTLMGRASIPGVVKVAGAGCYPSDYAIVGTDYSAGELIVNGGSAATVELAAGGTVRMTGGAVTMLDVTGNGVLTVTDGTVETLKVERENATVILSGGEFKTIQSTGRTLPKLLASNYAYAIKTGTGDPEITAKLYDVNTYSCADGKSVTVVLHTSHTPSEAASDAVTTRCACGQSLTLAITNGDSTTYFTDFDANALSNLRSGGTAKLISNTHLTTNVTMPETSFTLDLNGFNISDGGYKKSITVPEGSAMTLTVGNSPQGKSNSSVIPPITVNGELTVVGDVAVNSIGCEPNGKLTAGNDSDTAQPTISTLTVHGNPAGRVALKNGVELMNICFGTGETYTLLDLLGAGQAFFAEDGNPIEANVNSHSSAMVTVGAHTSCDYTSGTNGHCACGRACPHDTFDDATGKCDDCHAQMAAKIVEGGVLGVGATTTYFSSFADAVKAAQSGNTITLLTAAASTESAVSFPAGIYTIDLNGKTIGCALTLDFGADVTVKDGTKTDSAKLSRKMSILNVTGEILVKAGDAGAGKLTLKNGVRTAKVVLHNIEGGQRNGMLAVDTGASINELHVRGDHGMALGIDNETLNLSGTDITLGEVSQGSMLNLGAGATVGDITMASASTLEITGGTADEVNVMALGSVRMTGGKVEAMIIEAIPQDESTAKLEYFDISGGEIGALTLGDTGVTMYTSIQKGLTGGSYGKIELKGGATGISLYDLLGENRAFYATDSGLRVEVQGKETGNVTVKAPCAHYDKIDAAGLCSECAIQHVAKVTKADGTLVGWYETLFLAVGQATGGIVTLVADVPAATNNDASLLEATYTIDLNGHKIGINLTVPEVANVTLKGDAPGSAVTGKITMEEVEGSKAPAGALTIESGTYKEIEAQAGALNVTGGTITKLTENGGNVKLSGGHFEKIETCTEGKAVRDLLKSGYAFKKDDAFVLWGNADINSSLCSDVDVAACVHQAIVLGNECLYCGKPLVAQLVADDETSFYTSFEAAYAAVPATGESVITLLRDSNDSSATHQVNKTFRLLLGGHELKDKLDIVAGGCLTVANSSGSTLDAIEQTGGTLKVNADAQAVIKELTVSGGETQLSGGTYNSITVTAAGKTVGDLLAENSAYYQTAAGGGKIWLTVANETALQNVSVGRIPLLDITLTASPESLTYGGVLTLTASRVYDADYKWFEVVNGAETAIATPEPDPNPNTRTLTPDAGSHTYRCKVTKDGYTVTLDKTVTVAKADIDTPKPKTSLIYNGGAQELILAGDTLPSGCTIQYKLGADGTYGTDASALKGTDAKTYTVYYYVDGGTNYNSIGSADKPREIKVTIAPRDLDRTDTRYVSISSGVDLTYNGQQQTPEFTLTLNSCDDPTSPSLIETLTLGTDYTQSVKKKTDVGTYTAELKGKGNYTGTKTVDWNIKKAPAPTAADGTLLVYNQVARSYTFDFASLLPTLPKGCEYGKLSYALNAVGTEANTSVITAAGYLGDYSLAQSTLTLPVNAVNSSAVDTIAKLRVTVTSDNYENITLTLNVDRINRASPVDVAAPVEGLTKDNVTSDSREALETLRDDLADYLASDPLDDEREELEDLQETVDELLKQLDEAKAAMEDDAIGAADDIDASNAKPGHKGKLRSAKKAAQAALEKFGPNYTAKEKAALNDTIARIDAALAAIDKAESDANKPVKTGDESMPILWIVLLVAAAGCVVILLAARKKKK